MKLQCNFLRLFFHRTGLVYESNSTEHCNNLPVNKRDVPIRSIKTDTCVMVYYNLNCRSHSKKFNHNKRLVFSKKSFKKVIILTRTKITFRF